MVGKWHLCPTVEMNIAATRRNWPCGRGFERFVRLPWRGDEPVVSGPGLRQPPGRPAEARPSRATTSPRTSPTRRSSSSRTPRPSRRKSRSSCTTRPAPPTRRTTSQRNGPTSSGASSTWATRPCGSRPWPGRRSWASSPPTPTCRRSTRSAPPETRTGPDGQPFPPLDFTRPWDSLTADEKRLFARMAEVYAGFLAHADHHIGRLLDYLEESGQRENTMVVLVSDNGASGEGGPDGSVNEMKFANGIPDDMQANLAMLDELGGNQDLQPLPQRLGDGVQHAVQDVEALRVQRRHRRPVHHLLALGHSRLGRAGRAAAPVPPRDRHRADHPGHPGSRRARRRSTATCRAASTA